MAICVECQEEQATVLIEFDDDGPHRVALCQKCLESYRIILGEFKEMDLPTKPGDPSVDLLHFDP